MDDVLVRAEMPAIGLKFGESSWLARTPMIDGMIRRGYLTVLETRPAPESALEDRDLPEE